MEFGEVRSLVNTTDDDARQSAWPRLIDAMEAALAERPDEATDVWLPYVLQGLERWPDRLRVAPREWMNTVIRGDHVGVLMSMVTAIDAEGVNNPRFQTLCERRDVTWVRHLRFSGYKFKLASARALGASEAFTNLRALELLNISIGSQKLRAIMSGSFVAGLTDLRIRRCGLARKDLAVMFKVASLPSLVRLDLADNFALDVDSLSALASADLPALRELDLSQSWITSEALDLILGASWLPQLDVLELERSYHTAYLEYGVSNEARNEREGVAARIRASGLRPEVAEAAVESLS
jgi:hypothetical protein